MLKGLERIKVLASEITNKATLKIVNYLLSREDMNEKYLNEEKSLKQMFKFIIKEAEKQQEDGVAVLEDAEVYNLAIHYWDESNEDLGLNKIENSEKKIEERKIAKEIPKVEQKKKNWIPEGQLSLFDL